MPVVAKGALVSLKLETMKQTFPENMNRSLNSD